MKTWKAIGLMSGSSLDGLDVAYCEFVKDKNGWKYEIKFAETVDYSEKWKKILKNIRDFKPEALIKAHNEYGILLGQTTDNFIKKYHLSPDIISSHGHTVFHNPAQGYTFQLGNGQAVANVTGITTVADFRTGDILLGGQGAPLVPVGDKLLFNDYQACVNIGGIANISYDDNGKRLAYDVCPANQLLNNLALLTGKPFDKDGELAEQGLLNSKILSFFESDEFYRKPLPKSLSNEYVWKHFIKPLETYGDNVKDKLFTASEHVAGKIAEAINNLNKGKILITGGGARNKFLIRKIRDKSYQKIIVPEPVLIDFKEALIFAFMGVLRVKNEINTFASATGAKHDAVVGVLFEKN